MDFYETLTQTMQKYAFQFQLDEEFILEGESYLYINSVPCIQFSKHMHNL